MTKSAKKLAKITPIRSFFPIRKRKEVQSDIIRGNKKILENFPNGEIIDTSSYNNRALSEFGNVARDMFFNMNNEVMENYRNFISRYMETTMEVLKCKNATDVENLQSQALQRMIEGCVEQASKFSEVLFGSYTNALNPLNEFTLPTSEDMTPNLSDKSRAT